jgi:hypothetical protein
MTITRATADELDAAILAILGEARDQSMWWADIRDQLPASTFWQRVESLTRLDVTGAVDVVKIDGRDYVALSLIPAYLSARGVA